MSNKIPLRVNRNDNMANIRNNNNITNIRNNIGNDFNKQRNIKKLAFQKGILKQQDK